MTTATNKTAFTIREREQLREIVIHEFNNNLKTLKEAFLIAGIKLSKKADHCKSHWYQRLHFKYGKDLIKSNEVKRETAVKSSAWHPEEDEILSSIMIPIEEKDGVKTQGFLNAMILLPGRTLKSCENRWNQHLKNKPKVIEVVVVEEPAQLKFDIETIPVLNAKSWLPQEDFALTKYALPLEGARIKDKWKYASYLLNGTRTPAACEKRWREIKSSNIGNQAQNNQVIMESKVEPTITQLSDPIQQVNDYLNSIEQRMKSLNDQVTQLVESNTILNTKLDAANRENGRLTTLNKKITTRSKVELELQTQVEVLQEQLTLASQKYAKLENDNRSLLGIFETARKLQVDSTLGPYEKTKYKNDGAGNIEKVKQ